MIADDWTEKQRAQFVIKDNVNFGDWDFDMLANEWEENLLIDWGIDIPINLEEIEKYNGTDKEVEEDFNKIKDSDATNPIVPEFMENYNCFVIVTKNEIDETFIRNLFKLTAGQFSNNKGLSERASNVISVEKIKELWQEK